MVEIYFVYANKTDLNNDDGVESFDYFQQNIDETDIITLNLLPNSSKFEISEGLRKMCAIKKCEKT